MYIDRKICIAKISLVYINCTLYHVVFDQHVMTIGYDYHGNNLIRAMGSKIDI